MQIIPVLQHNVQLKPPYHCPYCKTPARNLVLYGEWMNPRSLHKQLDDYSQQIGYLLTDCTHNTRVAVLGFAIAPLEWPSDHCSEPRKVHVLTRVLSEMAAFIPTHQVDTITRIVYELLSGRLTPDSAIAQLKKWMTSLREHAIDTTLEFAGIDPYTLEQRKELSNVQPTSI